MTTTRAPATTWQVDAGRSTAGFVVGNLGVRQVHGTVPVLDGSVVTDDGGHVLSVRGALDATGVDTGNAHRDRDLRAPRLLDVAQTPTWTFSAAGAERDGDGWRLEGVLTVRRPCSVVLAVAPAVEQADGSLRLRATTSLDRRDAGVTAPRALVGRLVLVDLDVVLLPQR